MTGHSRVLLGCIADDMTGATDLANTLVKGGMRTVQTIGQPEGQAPAETDAVVVALKSRTAPVREAVAHSLAALDWLRQAGARQFFFKYCSTFDSTDAGNIGPVADALLAALGEGFAIVCPAFPETGRTVYLGHHFVCRRLLSESSMRDHPLTPMTDSDLVRVLGRQTSGAVDLVPYGTVRQGADSIAAAFSKLAADGVRYAVVDALEDAHLRDIGRAAATLRLVTGGSGLALGLPDNFRRRGQLGETAASALPEVNGAAAVLAGSCSAATLAQVAEMKRRAPALALDPLKLAKESGAVDAALSWAREHLAEGPVLLYASQPPEEVAKVRAALGRERAAAAVEEALARLAEGLVAEGVRRLVVAGGETSGAVVQRLGVKALKIGPEIDPGVPWTMSVGEPRLALALKSGNFGAPDFFMKALDMLP